MKDKEGRELTYVKLTKEARRLAKVQAATVGISLQEYIERLIINDNSKKEEGK